MTLKTWNSSGQLLFDADTIATSGVCLGIYEVPANTAFSQSYPGYTGSTLRVLNPEGGFTWNATVDNALGYPRVTCPAVPGVTQISVWAMTRPTFSPGPGLVVTRPDQSSLILSPSGTGLYLIGDASPYDTVYNSGNLTSTGEMGYTLFQVVSSIPFIPVLEVVQGFWTEFFDFQRISSNVYQFKARRCSTTTTDSTGFNTQYTPRVLIYGQRAAPVGPPYFYINRSDGTLAWDLMVGSNMLLGALATPSFTAATGSQSVSIGNASEVWGLVGPSGGYRRTGTVTGATWRMRTLQRMFTRNASNQLVLGEIATDAYLADANESNSYTYATDLFLTKHTGL